MKLADDAWRDGVQIIAIGSSSTQGIGASAPEFTYPAQLQERLKAMLGLPVKIENLGVGGETITATLARLKAALATFNTDLVIWQVGTNDAVTGADETQFRSQLADGLAALRATKTPFLLIDPQFYPAITNVARYENYVRDIHELGAAYGAPVFPRYALMRAWAAQSDGLLREMLSKDQFHMSDRGYGCLAQNLAIDIAPLWSKTPAEARMLSPPTPLVK